MRKVVGIDRKIKRTWLDAVLDRLVKTTDEAELRTFFDKHLKGELPGKESRAKSIGIVLRIWSGIPPERLTLRDRAVAMLPRITGQERIWLHWGMTALAYPFFRDTAEVVGRLLALQDDFTTAQVQARLLTTWGDRATSREAAQKLLNTLVDWEVLRSTKTRGHFLLARKMKAGTADLQLWLLEALLGASTAEEVEAQQLLRLPESFPFALNVGMADLRRHEGFYIHRQGLDMDMVALRKVKAEEPPKKAKKPRKAKSKSSEPGVTSLFEQSPEHDVLNNGRPRTGSEVPVVTSEDSQQDGQVDQRPAEDAARKQGVEPGAEQPGRYRVREIMLAPDNPFATTAAECARQFRDGQYFGCLALSLAVMEALVYHVWQTKLHKQQSQDDDFEAKVKALHKKGVIKDEWKVKLDQTWAGRRTFHQLRPSVEADQLALSGMARNNLQLLGDLQAEFFGYTMQEGKITPNHPEYWSIKEGATEVL